MAADSMNTTNEIPAALDAAGWAEVDRMRNPETGAVEFVLLDGAAHLARLNAYLPDDSPHKLTRAGLQALTACVDASEGRDMWPSDQDLALARTELAKLASLLPPEAR